MTSAYLELHLRRLATVLFETRRVAWMGGSRPAFPVVDVLEYEVALLFFIEQWNPDRDYWHEDPIDKDMRQTFWDRACYDAHATLRDWRRPIT